MPAYKKITDLKVYVQELLNSGAPVCTAEKTARILACPGVPGKQVISWSVDAGGAAVKEKEAVVSTDGLDRHQGGCVRQPCGRLSCPP